LCAIFPLSRRQLRPMRAGGPCTSAAAATSGDDFEPVAAAEKTFKEMPGATFC